MNCNSDKNRNAYLDLTDFFRSSDVSEEFDRFVMLDEYDEAKEFCEAVHIFGTVKNSLGVISFKAEVSGKLTSVCARCCEPVSMVLNAKLKTVLTASESKDDSVAISGGKIDLAKTAYDALSLEIPLLIYCREDCKGLCQQCGANLNDGDCGCIQ